MLNFIKALMSLVFVWETTLYLYNYYTPQVIITDTWDIQEVRLTLALLSAIMILLCSIFDVWKDNHD